MEPTAARKKIFIITTIIIVAALVIVGIAVTTATIRNETITIEASPMDSTITLDGKAISTGKHTIAKGKHTLVATRPHFDKLTKEIDTAALGESKTVYLMLLPNDDAGHAYLLNNNDEQLIREKASGAEISRTQQSILERYPIVSKLPYDTAEFSIDYEVDDKKNIQLTITLYAVDFAKGTLEHTKQVAEYKKAALDFIKEEKLDASTVKITYVELAASDTHDPGDEPTQTEIDSRQ
ncbi:MAG TPA: hypothetical protein VJ836_07210 [Candidatus Saccharimonadales bacterium]|nr:hypothetical protein [Candidatus Saccharimonadales bacterium]